MKSAIPGTLCKLICWTMHQHVAVHWRMVIFELSKHLNTMVMNFRVLSNVELFEIQLSFRGVRMVNWIFLCEK